MPAGPFRATGASALRIVLGHVLSNVLGPILIGVPVAFATWSVLAWWISHNLAS